MEVAERELRVVPHDGKYPSHVAGGHRLRREGRVLEEQAQEVHPPLLGRPVPALPQRGIRLVYHEDEPSSRGVHELGKGAGKLVDAPLPFGPHAGERLLELREYRLRDRAHHVVGVKVLAELRATADGQPLEEVARVCAHEVVGHQAHQGGDHQPDEFRQEGPGAAVRSLGQALGEQPDQERRQQKAQQEAEAGAEDVLGPAAVDEHGHAHQADDQVDGHAQRAQLRAQQEAGQQHEQPLQREGEGVGLGGQGDADERPHGDQRGEQAAQHDVDGLESGTAHGKPPSDCLW